MAPGALLRSSLLAFTIAGGTLLGACSSSDNDDDTTSDTSGTTSGSTAGGTGDTTGSTGGGTGGAIAAGLGHGTTPVPVNAADPVGTSFDSAAGRNALAARGEPLAIMQEVVDNHGGDAFAGMAESCQSLGAEYASCSISNLHLKDQNGALSQGGWKIYFHNIRRVLRVDSDEYTVSHVNGDLNVLEPAADFDGVDDGLDTIAMVTEFNYLQDSDFMPRAWLVDANGNVTLLPNTDTDENNGDFAMPVSGDNRYAYMGEPSQIADASNRFTANASVVGAVNSLTEREIQARIIPSPRSITVGTGSLDISGGFSFASLPLAPASIEALTARQQRFMNTGAGVALAGGIDSALPAGSYTLDVTAGGITLAGADDEALFHAAQSLLALVEPGVGTIPLVSIEDSPRFGFRGMHLDIARNFHDRASIESLIDNMSAWKLNRLHLHLADDEGWRLQIPSLPELTDVGARREFRLDADGNVSEAASLMPQLGSGPNADNAGTGFLSRADFVAILQYATARHVVILPEFDMPAHSRAAVIAMRARAANLGNVNDTNVRIDDPEDTSRYLTIQHYDDGILNPCVPGTRSFIETVMADVKAMYDEAGAPLPIWHMGGDEARNVFRGNGFQDVNASDRVAWRGDVTIADWDLPWERSPACQSLIASNAALNSRDDIQLWFVREVADSVNNAGIDALYAFQDIYDDMPASDLATARAGVGFWESVSAGGVDNIDGFVNRGYEVVVATPDFLYFDFPQEVNPLERGYYWAARYTDTKKVFSFAPENLAQNAETSLNRDGSGWSATTGVADPGFHGMQGQLWSETVRTREQLEFMLYPRMIALAERAWHRADWELDGVAGRSFSESTNFVDDATLARDFALFTQALVRKELPKLDAAGVGYRIPVPGASSASGALELNLALPGLPLEVSSDGSNFTAWQGSSTAPVVAIRALSADGSRAGRAETLN